MTSEKNMNTDRMCFACGSDNPIGLGLQFEFSGENKVKAEFIPGEVHQGFDGIMHGGLVSTLLDEAMAKVINMKGIRGVTAEMKTRFKHPVKIGINLVVSGILKDRYKKIIYTEAELKDTSGKLYARAEAKFMPEK